MVKRFVTFLFLFVFLLSLFVCPAFAADVMESDSDMFGFSYDDSNIFFTDKRLRGDAISVDTQLLQCSRLYFYIPVSRPCETLDFYFSLVKTTGSISINSADYGSIYNNSYHYSAALDLPVQSWLGSNGTEGSSARFISYKLSWSSLPFTSNASLRFIRVSVDYTGGTGNQLVLWLNKNLDQSLDGTVSADSDHRLGFSGTHKITGGNASYSGTMSLGARTVTINSGYLKAGNAAHVSGYIRSYYTQTNYVDYLLRNSGTMPYLSVSMPEFSPNSSAPLSGTLSSSGTGSNSESGTITLNNVGGTMSGNIVTGSLASSLTGSFLNRTYVDTVVMSATRSYSDLELIQAVNDASDRNHTDITTASDRNHTDITTASNRNHTDITNFYNRNHTDLQAISSQLGELVDHQDQVNQTGDDIGSTTSQSSISDTSSSLSSGSDSLSGVLSTASDISSVSGAAAPYISFIGAAMPIILNFGNGVLAWAVVGIIACSVFLWILKKVAE